MSRTRLPNRLKQFAVIWGFIALFISSLLALALKQADSTQHYQHNLRQNQVFVEHLEHLYSVTRVIGLIHHADPTSSLPVRITKRVLSYHPELLHLSLHQAEQTTVLHTQKALQGTDWPRIAATDHPTLLDAHLDGVEVALLPPEQHPMLGPLLRITQRLPAAPDAAADAPKLYIHLALQIERMLEHVGLNPARHHLHAMQGSADETLLPRLAGESEQVLHVYDRKAETPVHWLWQTTLVFAVLLLLGIPLNRAWNRQQLRVQRTLQAARRISDQARSKTQLLGSFSHDLRTPLTRLRLRAEEHADTRSANLRDIGQIERFINASLEYLRSEPSQEPMQALNLDALVRDWVALGIPGLDRSLLEHAIPFHGAIQRPYVGRATDLQRCLQNLLANALRYGAPPISVHLFDDIEAVRIQVRDHGPGIPEPELERLLQPFQRGSSLTEPEGGRKLAEDHHMGFGLGLAIASELCESHLGELRLRNADDGGLIAEMWLPR